MSKSASKSATPSRSPARVHISPRNTPPLYHSDSPRANSATSGSPRPVVPNLSLSRNLSLPPPPELEGIPYDPLMMTTTTTASSEMVGTHNLTNMMTEEKKSKERATVSAARDEDAADLVRKSKSLSMSTRGQRDPIGEAPGAASSSRAPPTRHLVVDHGVIDEQLDALHDDLLACKDFGQQKREECESLLHQLHDLLRNDSILKRVESASQQRSAVVEEVPAQKEEAPPAAASSSSSRLGLRKARPSTSPAASTTATGRSRLASRATATNSANADAPEPAPAPTKKTKSPARVKVALGGPRQRELSPVRPQQQPWGIVDNQKVRVSWQKLVTACRKKMTEEELSLLSLETVRHLMHYYNLDRSAVDIANIELYWRALAQQREDERSARALPHKKCQAAHKKSVTAAARQLSQQFSPKNRHQYGSAEEAASFRGAGSMAGSPRASRAGSFRVNPGQTRDRGFRF